MLRSKEWVSSVDFVNAYMLRAQARVFELRREGYEIESRKVEGKSYDEYRLVRDKVVKCGDEKERVQEKVYKNLGPQEELWSKGDTEAALSSLEALEEAEQTTHLPTSAQNMGTLQENNQKTLW